jgi:hypothetical protein
VVAAVRPLRARDARLAGAMRFASAYGCGLCVLCGRTFTFCAAKVPTVTTFGEVRPICQACMDAANRTRARRGLPRLNIQAGAYEPEPS